MKKALILGMLLLPTLIGGAREALANAPRYEADPFGDNDFANEPLILDVAHPSRGRGEIGLMFATSVIDKYNSHLGGMLELSYHLIDSIGIALNVGYFNGSLTQIVTDPRGIVGLKAQAQTCTNNPSCDLTPKVPDLKQITGVVGAGLIWAPFYGKINVVSELDVNLQLYGVLGLGVNGTRTAELQNVGHGEFNILNNGFGDSGFFSDTKVHLNIGGGLKVFVADWLNLRAEYRLFTFRDSFDFDRSGEEQGYFAAYHLAQVGLGFILF